MIKRLSSSNVLPNTLGELELLVLEALWQKPHLDAKTVRDQIPIGRRTSLNKVQSTLERLFEKQLVDRVTSGYVYTYFASISRSNLLNRLMGDVITLLHDGKLETILSSFVSVAPELDERSLAELEELITVKKLGLSKELGDDQ
jgi:predicted transcriptional regulator